jgi:hypothetical protein
VAEAGGSWTAVSVLSAAWVWVGGAAFCANATLEAIKVVKRKAIVFEKVMFALEMSVSHAPQKAAKRILFAFSRARLEERLQ